MSASTEAASSRPCVYTLGYAGWTIEQVAAALARTGAQLVDIRLKPWSRKPGFSAGALRGRFGDDYTGLPAFGNLNYRGGPVRLQDAEEGLAVVRRLLAGRPVLFLCGCKDLDHCHRKDAAALVQQRLGAAVVHLPAPTE